MSDAEVEALFELVDRLPSEQINREALLADIVRRQFAVIKQLVLNRDGLAEQLGRALAENAALIKAAEG